MTHRSAPPSFDTRSVRRSATGLALAASTLVHAAAIVAAGLFGATGMRSPAAPAPGPLVVHVAIAPLPRPATAPVVDAEGAPPPRGPSSEGRVPSRRAGASPVAEPSRLVPPDLDAGPVAAAPGPPAQASREPVAAPEPGGQASEPARVPARYLSTPEPAYPRLAREDELEGVVVLRVRITIEGRASQVVVERSSGHDSLDRAALDAVARWTFVPAREAGAPVESWMRVPVRFRLG